MIERENWDKISSQKLSRDQYVNGDLNGHYSDEEQTETDNTEIQIQRHNRENSETLYDNIQHPTNVDILANDQLASDKILPNERVTTESESEEEFCDTSDQPSPVSKLVMQVFRVNVEISVLLLRYSISFYRVFFLA